MTRARHSPKVLLAICGALVVGAVLWRIIAVPALVKFPTDADVTPRYEGTLTMYVNPATAAPLPTPTQVPLSIERHLKALTAESDSANVVVEETIVEKAGTLLNTTQRNVYVMDRRTLSNVADGRAYAFDPSNVVDRSGAYRLNLPFGTSPTETYPIYKNEIAATYQIHRDSAQPTMDEGGLQLDGYVASVNAAPLSDAYLAELDKSVPLPRSLTLDQLKPQLLQVGVDVDALLAALTPVITPADLAALTQLAAGAVPLRYVLSFDGRTAIESTTGALVHVTDTESIAARPELASLPQLREVLGHYPTVPQAVAANEGLGKLAGAPATKLFEIRYDQTAASVADMAAQVESNRTKALAVTWYVPAGLLVAGLLALIVGGFLLWRKRVTEVIDLRAPAPAATARAPEPTEPAEHDTQSEPVRPSGSGRVEP